ncbi:MAG TPA: hypothetical protein VMT05_03050 [Terriglobales bacterium]|jgi:hypothetical protein|nr:hypothetical protein [Terriglobales bacterium]
MPTLDRLLDRLEQEKTNFSRGNAAEILRLLAALGRRRFDDPRTLIRFHDALLFLRVYPHNAAVLHQAERLLGDFVERVERLHEAGAEMAVFDPEQVSGIAGTTMQDTWNYDVVRWLARRFPRHVSIDWADYDQESRLAATLPRFIPLLADDADVEADVPFTEWLRTASGRRGVLPWLLERFERLPISEREKAELYNSLGLSVKWELDNLRASRTRNWRPVRRVFYHQGPLLRRNEVALAKELASPLPVRRLSRREGERVMDLVREIMAVRYRELYGTTLGDPASVVEARPGRGTQIFLWGLAPGRRLPLRAYLAGFTLKNGVPINYIEGISLFEWMEVGFNTFYAYRDGESAWHYAQALRLLSQLHRVRCISVYPYQLGDQNEEAIASGAFWFYRKLGFRPGRLEIRRLLQREEEKIAARPGYRTPAARLRKLAAGHVFYELPGAEVGAWDRFRVRNLGFRVNRFMAEHFAGDAEAMRRSTSAKLARVLGVNRRRLSPPERAALEDFAVALALMPDFLRWSRDEKDQLAAIIRVKAGADEARYVRLLQSHSRLRAAVLRLGS